MKKRNIFIALIIILFLLIAVCFIYYFTNNRTYKINLPELEKLESITLEKDENEKIITNNEEMKEILEILKGRNTKTESIQDEPVNISNKVKIKINFKEIGQSILFIYEKDNKCYIEQPYNGIYKISGDEYNSIEKYIR